MKDDMLVAELRKVCDSLFSHYDATARSEVEELQSLIDPRAWSKGHGLETTARFRHCPVAKASLDVLTSAHSTYITPHGQRWFSLKSRDVGKAYAGRRSAVANWYSKTTEIMQNELAESSFYTVLQEVYNDRCLGGTGAMFIGEGDDSLLFTHIPLGSYAIEEDGHGNVNVLVRRFRFSPAQAAAEWGVENLSDAQQAKWKDEGKRYSEKHEYLHLVRPREHATKGVQDVPASEQEFEGFYLDGDTYEIVGRDNYYEFPFLVTRFIRGNDSPYGVAPGVGVIPVIRQLLKLERLMDVQAEVATFPRVLQLARQNRQVDLRAGGITTVSQEEARLNLPREWGTLGRYDIGLERIKAKEGDVRRAFYVDMLNAISNIDRQMTATEINAREAEKVLAFSPSFSLFISDFRVAMRRILGILFRAGKLPEDGVPRELFKEGSSGKLVLLNPQVCYLGKIAQAIERVQRRGINEALESIIAYTQSTQDASMLEALKPRAIARYIVEASGAPSDIMLTDAELEELDERKRQAALLAQQNEQQMVDADSLHKVAGALQKG